MKCIVGALSACSLGSLVHLCNASSRKVACKAKEILVNFEEACVDEQGKLYMINSKIVCTLLFELCHISMEERDELILLNSVTMMVELSNNKGLH
jgi:hypothetical protein